jgi:2-methylfumaryl-CoA hydratase
MPFADDLVIGQPLSPAPEITIDEGLAAQYQSITGDPLQLPLSGPLSRRVAGVERVVNPGLVLQIAIGQSTVATRRVIANLFYRDVVLERQVGIGTTLRTVVTPLARQRTRTPGRAKVLLDISCADERGDIVARFQRLALLPCLDDSLVDVGEVGAADSRLPLERFAAKLPREWSIKALPHGPAPVAGTRAVDPLPDPVTSALELVRLTQNIALAHRDARTGQKGRRLVYGGHVVGLAQASLVRMFPSIVTILGWRSCDHRAPVFEGQTVRHQAVVRDSSVTPHGTVLGISCQSFVDRDREEPPLNVLEWEPVVLCKSES